MNNNQACEIVSNFAKKQGYPMLETLMFLEDNLAQQSDELQRAYIITKMGFQKMFTPINEGEVT